MTTLTILAAGATVAAATPIHGYPPEAATALPPASVAASLSVASSTSSPPSLVARSGDTLWDLAKLHCGRGGLYPRLAAASGIRNPNLIVAGRTRIVLDCGATPRAVATATSRSTVRPQSTDRAQRAVVFALAQVGKPYVWAAAGPNAYDCSGLVMAAYARVGVRLPHYSMAMLHYGRPVARADLRPGDVIWPYAGHVVMYIGSGRIVESPQPGQRVHTTRIYAFWTARRMV